MRRSRPDSRRKWITIVAIVVLFHVAVLLYLRPSHFRMLQRDIALPAGESSAASGSYSGAIPDAIIAIPIDVEPPADVAESKPVVPRTEASPQPPPQTPRPPASGSSGAAGEGRSPESLDIGDIMGGAGAREGGSDSRPGQTVLPRPIEITWPDTRRLGHCIGLRVNVRVLVNEKGGIDRLEPGASTVPDDCLRAAVDAAARIKFMPGSVDGKPAALWTQVRIDFEKRH